MLEWVQTWPDWLQTVWFAYVTFHDLIQWAVIVLFGLTAWGQRHKKRQLEELIEHIHEELHKHIREDSSFHEDLGQSGMTRGE
jgi:hypothetical protein